jgi:hypothetical protein
LEFCVEILELVCYSDLEEGDCYMDCKGILKIAKEELTAMNGNIISVLDIMRPTNIEYAKQLAKVVSKLSPLIGNMIEFTTVDLLNTRNWDGHGKWIRQDPGFPDALFQSESILPNPGIEIKAWFPFATEITARFKDSTTAFSADNIDVALIAWLPENIVWGKPKIIDVLVVSGRSIAEARDIHYHKPPGYIVFEPEDTVARTINLQQTNTNGYKFQADKSVLSEADSVVDSWGEAGRVYSPSPEYQRQLRELHGQFVYRLDTNYAKMDRIGHAGIEDFKQKVLNTQFNGKSIAQWSSTLASQDIELVESALNAIL